MYYKLKDALRIFDLRKYDGNLYIGVNFPTAITITNPTNDFVKLLYMLDGTRTLDEISKQISVSSKVVKSTIDELIKLQVVDKVSDSKELTSFELDYYSRQLDYFSIFPDTISMSLEKIQKLLKEKNIVIVGMGGGGTNVARQLAAIGIGTLTLIDEDKIELSNIPRQILYSVKDVGKYKVDVAKDKLNQINPEININIIKKYITSVYDVKKYIENADFVFLTADEPVVEILNWINKACVELDIPFITFGVSEFTCTVGPFIVPHKSPCINCIDYIENKYNEFRTERIRQIKNYDFPISEPVFPSLVSIISAIAVFEVIRYMITNKSNLIGKSVAINPYNWKITKSSWKRNLKCDICGSNSNIN